LFAPGFIRRVDLKEFHISCASARLIGKALEPHHFHYREAALKRAVILLVPQSPLAEASGNQRQKLNIFASIPNKFAKGVL